MSAARQGRAATQRLEAARNATRVRAARLTDAWAHATLPRRAPGTRRRRWGRGISAARTRPAAQGLLAPVAAVLVDRRPPRRALAIILAGLLAILGGLWLWFRDSPFVSVSTVQITGVSGPDVPQIEQALRAAAVTMTTLDVNMHQLRSAVESYPDVRSLTVQTQFPHGLVIHVDEQVPIAQLRVDGRSMAISRDGTLLQDTRAAARLPTLPVPVPPAGARLTEPGPRLALTVLAAAPYRLLAHIFSARQTARSGVVVQLRRGPQLRFGDVSELAAKWAAALAVLGNPSSRGAQYIDVTDPGRPAAGAPTGSSSSTGAPSSGTASGTSSGTSSGTASGTAPAASSAGPASSGSTAVTPSSGTG